MNNQDKLIQQIADRKEVCWINKEKKEYAQVRSILPLKKVDIDEASRRLKRFAPFLEECFPETRKNHGLIESPFTSIPETKASLLKNGFQLPEGRLYIKQDNCLDIAGSVKARGGVYEVLKVAEDIAIKEGIITENADYAVLKTKKDVFKKYKIQVGSTGNLGLSIGIMSAAIGFEVTVHMSSDAKQWKKDLLRQKGVKVIEYDSDYSMAVAEGRKAAEKDALCHFVDDEHSKDLFLGYAVAAERLKRQFEEQGIVVDEKHPLFVYLPCGVGGAPGGITFGLKEVFGEAVHCFFVEPVECPCMVLGLASKKHEQISIKDVGLSGKTAADGLAVGRCSSLSADMMEYVLDGEITVSDKVLNKYMRILEEANGIFIEPSSCAAFAGYTGMAKFKEAKDYIEENNLGSYMKNAVHVLWATGGSLVPESIREKYRNDEW